MCCTFAGSKISKREDYTQFNGDMDQTDMKPTPKLPKLRYTSSVSNGRTVGQTGHLLLELFTIRLAVEGV
jgi:hypothetical protein